MWSAALIFLDFLDFIEGFLDMLLTFLWIVWIFWIHLWFFGYWLTCAWCGDWMGALLHCWLEPCRDHQRTVESSTEQQRTAVSSHPESTKNSHIYSDKSTMGKYVTFHYDIDELRTYHLGEYFPHRVHKELKRI